MITRVARSFGLLVVLYGVISIASFAVAFVPTSPNQDTCEFGTVSNPGYQALLKQAKAQQWTVWPDLSNGLFWPTDRGIYPQSRNYDQSVDAFLQSKISALSPAQDPFDRRLAASHALMRAMNLTFVKSQQVAGVRTSDGTIPQHLIYMYRLPQRRFAPLCAHCFYYTASIMKVSFEKKDGEEPRLRRVFVHHTEPKYDSRVAELDPQDCPSI